MRTTLYAIFAVSGLAGLVYEMIWSRYLALFLGHSAYAQVLVIAIFLGGMALGAALVGRRSARLADPLKGYAAVELVAGVFGIFFPEIYAFVTGIAYDTVLPATGGSAVGGLVTWLFAILLILPQSVLLGATFPLMAAGVLRRPGAPPGRVLGVLYFANSIGAAAGAPLAGFYLVAESGLPGTTLVAGMLNLAVALATMVIVIRWPAEPAIQVEQESQAPVDDAARSAGIVRLLLIVSFGTAVASFVYEIGWLRMLALVLGSATHSFEIMLSAFILGLALGAFWVRRRADRWPHPLCALGVVQVLMGLAALGTLAVYGASFRWMAVLLDTFAQTDGGYAGFTLSKYVISLAVMFPASFFAGMTLPLITRTLLVRGAGEGAIGLVYGVNTFGAIVGVAAAGLIGLPLLGLKGLIVAGATLDLALGIWLLHRARMPWPAAARVFRIGTATAGVAIVFAILAGSFDPRLVTSGVYRHGRVRDADQFEMLYYEDGRTATVGVTRGLASGLISISTNGKPDASLHEEWRTGCTATTERLPLTQDQSTQSLAPLLALAYRPDARSVAVIGQGSGMSSHLLLGHPAPEAVHTIEIERAMIEGSRAFYPANRRVFDDPRSGIIIADARQYFSAAGRRYDLVFSEPSNPWVSGVASLFTVEFYEHIRGFLADDGVFGQWLHLYEMDDALVLTILGAVHRVFGAYEIHLTSAADLLIVATPGTTLRAPDWTVFDAEGLADDLCHVVPPDSTSLAATYVAGRRALAPLLDRLDAVNSDFYPVVDLRAERIRYLDRSAGGLPSLPLAPFDPTAAFTGRRRPPGAPHAPIAQIPRVRALAIAAALQAPGAIAPADTLTIGDAVNDARWRRAVWEAGLRADPPADWTVWLGRFRGLERDLHLGTAGWADTAFFDGAIRYAERHAAPAPLVAFLRFRRALTTWDFRAAAVAGDALVAARAWEADWIPRAELLHGVVSAHLLNRDVEAATRALLATTEEGTAPPEDFITRLVLAYFDVFRGAGP